MISLQFNTLTLLTSLTLLIILLLIILGLYLFIHRKQRRSPPPPVTIITNPSPNNRFSYPLTQLPTTRQTFTQMTLEELPANYKTFDFARRARHHLSSDSSCGSATNRPSQLYPFGTIKSKIEKIPSVTSPNSDSEEIDTDFSSPSFEYSLVELFRFELFYKLYYSAEDQQLFFEILRLTPMQNLIEQCFSSFVCKIRLFLNDDKDKTKKYLSKTNPINESFPFDIEPNYLKKAYIKLQILGEHSNDKRLELGQTILVLNHYSHLNNPTEQYNKSIQIYEDRIDMIIRQQTKTENEARALICLVYENDRCLLHVGLIKILGIQYLLKQPTSHFHHRDQIQIKISTIIDGKINEKRKSKLFSIINGTCTFSTSFHFDYVSLHKTSINILIAYRRSLINSSNKPIAKIEFGSNSLKNQQIFQHWTDVLSAPNRPHIHWHTLESIHEN